MFHMIFPHKPSQYFPWISIWTHPRKTIRHLIDTNPKGTIIYLALLSGILSALSWLSLFLRQYPKNATFQHPLVIIGVLTSGAIIGGAHLYLGSWLYRMTGSWLGGTGNFEEVKCAIGWSNWPMIVSSLAHNLVILFIKHPLLLFIASFVNFCLYIWALVILFHLIGEAHRFSSWKALTTMFLAICLIFFALMILSLLLPLIHHLYVKPADPLFKIPSPK